MAAAPRSLGFESFSNRPGVQSVLYHFDREGDFADWTIGTEDQAGDGWDTGVGIVAGEAGGVVQDKSNGANDDVYRYSTTSPWYVGDRGSVLRYIDRFKLSDADGSAIIRGHFISNNTSNSPLDGSAYVVDGLGFIKEIGDAKLDFFTEKNGGNSTYTNRVNSIATLSNDTYVVVAYELRHSYLTSGEFDLTVWVDGIPIEGLTNVKYTSGVPDDVALPLAQAHRGGAGDNINTDLIGSQYEWPGEYVG